MLLKWFAVFVQRREWGKCGKSRREKAALRPDLHPGLAAFPAAMDSGGQDWAADGEGGRSSSFRKDL